MSKQQQKEGSLPPLSFLPESCPTCKMPLKDGRGWVKDYAAHSEHTGHLPRFGYCLVPCPTCVGQRTIRREAIRSEEQVARLFGSSHIPRGMAAWSFSTFPQGGDEQALAFVKAWVHARIAGDDPNDKYGLYLSGKAGRGKTGLAVSALHEAMAHGQSCLFILVADLMNRFRATFHPFRGGEGQGGIGVVGASEQELLETVKDVKWLVLDDLAVERPTPYVLEQLYVLLETRQSRGRFTIITSNLSTRELEAYWRPPAIDEGAFHRGVRIIERVRQYCEGITFTGRGNLRSATW